MRLYSGDDEVGVRLLQHFYVTGRGGFIGLFCGTNVGLALGGSALAHHHCVFTNSQPLFPNQQSRLVIDPPSSLLTGTLLKAPKGFGRGGGLNADHSQPPHRDDSAA